MIAHISGWNVTEGVATPLVTISFPFTYIVPSYGLMAVYLLDIFVGLMVSQLAWQYFFPPCDLFSTYSLLGSSVLFYNYLCSIVKNAFASFTVCSKWCVFDKLSNNQKTFSIFHGFPLSYSYSDTIFSATVHNVLALLSLKTSLFRDL